MKQNVFKFSGLLVAVAFVLALVACSSEGEQPKQPLVNEPHTYTLYLKGGLTDFGAATRADYEWSEGSKLYLQFVFESFRTAGTATYNEGVWTVTTERAINVDDEGVCEAYYFENATSQAAQRVDIGLHTAVYGDTQGTFIIDEETNAIIANALLLPLTGRVRFEGTAGVSFALSGLSHYTTYDVTSGQFTSTDEKITDRINDAATTDYYYVAFTDTENRRLIVDGQGASAYVRTFGENVLTTGQSGYITLPSNSDGDKWTLVNTENNQEIILPVLSSVATSQIRSYAATLTASVSSKGNGRLSQTGFVISTNKQPTLATGTRIDCGTEESLSARVNQLQAQTAYYVRAYATNERGTAYSEEAAFTTLSKEEDGTDFYRENYGEDEDLGGNPTSVVINIGHDGYEGDDSENNQQGSVNSGFDKDGFDEDENLGGDTPSSSTIGKNEYENDENWN